MTKLFLIGAAAAALITVPAAAQQDAARQGAQPLSLAAFQARVAAKFAATDVNRDGFITQAEAQAAAAARPSREQRLGTREQRQAKRAERLARFDTDKDGVISAAERQAGIAARGISQAENPQRAQRRAERRAERQAARGTRMLRISDKRFARLDADKDSRISLAEVSTRSATRFARLDANKDGSLTREERRTARAKREARRNG